MKNIRCFFDRDRSVSIQTHNMRIIASEIFKDSKGIAPNLFPNILIPMLHDNLSPHYQSGFQLNPG